MLMDSDACISVTSTLIRDVGEADGGPDLNLHPVVTHKVFICVRRSEVIRFLTSEVNQETSPSHSLFNDTLT